MAEFLLHEKEDGTYYGAIVRDGSTVFGLGGYEATVHNPATGELTPAGEKMAKRGTALRGYAHIGTYSKSKIFQRSDATERDIDKLKRIKYNY